MPSFRRHRAFRRRRARRRNRRRVRRVRFRRRRRMAMDPERKLASEDIATEQVTAGGAVRFLNGVGQGVTDFQRIGKQILCLSSTIHLELLINPNNTACFVRLALVQMKQPNGEELDSDELWLDPGTVASAFSLRNLPFVFKFRILWKRVVRLDAAKANVQLKITRNFRIITRMMNVGAQATAVITGSLWLVYMCNITDAANQPSIVASSRIRYVG